MGRGGAWLWHRHGCLFAYCGSLLWWMLAFARDLFHCARVSCARIFASWYAWFRQEGLPRAAVARVP